LGEIDIEISLATHAIDGETSAGNLGEANTCKG
jgi:hypothetical protein